ncbi:hypothetical protein [Paraflavitalea speifideaquila]|uniref:hypothetical protein n=1 Tax=Paraflavitalea speifideaquila TaxID=3076558 RepID=UPI0028E52B38|nr:hypothetical protein [Paraflavitalea speifideiaquila]
MAEELNEFGELFIKEVRDGSISILEKIINGQMKGAENKELHHRITKMSENDIEVVRDSCFAMIDTVIHRILFMFEQTENWLISNPTQGIRSINDISDGLSGELYGSQGWMQKFSEYPSDID